MHIPTFMQLCEYALIRHAYHFVFRFLFSFIVLSHNSVLVNISTFACFGRSPFSFHRSCLTYLRLCLYFTLPAVRFGYSKSRFTFSQIK